MAEPKSQCCRTVYTGYCSHKCQRAGTVERDGAFYCKQHDPVRIKEKDELKNKKWEQERLKRDERWKRESILCDLANGIPTDELECYELVLKGS